MAPLLLIKLVISLIAKGTQILAIHLIRAGILALHHCLAVDIPAAKGGIEVRSQIFIAGFISATPMSWERRLYKDSCFYTGVHLRILQGITLQFLLHSLKPLSCKRISLLCGALGKQGHTNSANSLTDRLCALARWAQITELGGDTCTKQEGKSFELAGYT